MDGLRALAALYVAVAHFKRLFIGEGGGLAVLSTPGASGVMLFFVLSGLCIGLSKGPRSSWLAFAARRFFRLYPACWFAMLCLACARFVILHKWFSLRETLGAVLILPTWFPAVQSLNPPLWSLQTEVELYFLFPAALCAMAAMPLRRFLLVSSLITAVACVAWFWLHPAFSYGYPGWGACYWLIWNLGLLLAFRAPRPFSWRQFVSGCALVVVGAALLLARNLFHSNAFALWFLLVGIGMYLLVECALSSCPAWLQNNVLVGLGKRSYSLYLLHMPVAWCCLLLFHSRGTAFLATVIGIALMVEVSYRFVEMPFVRLGKALASRVPTGA